MARYMQSYKVGGKCAQAFFHLKRSVLYSWQVYRKERHSSIKIWTHFPAAGFLKLARALSVLLVDNVVFDVALTVFTICHVLHELVYWLYSQRQQLTTLQSWRLVPGRIYIYLIVILEIQRATKRIIIEVSHNHMLQREIWRQTCVQSATSTSKYFNMIAISNDVHQSR